jgi:hypothetical protein
MDLSLVPTADLIDALKARFSHMIFAGIQVSGHASDEQNQAWTGHALFCQGLAMGLIRELQDWERDPETEGVDD